MKNFLVLLLLSYSINGSAQAIAPGDLKSKTYELKVQTIADANLKLPFESIKIIDSRFDTSMLGFGLDRLASLGSQIPFRKILLKPSIGKGIENFYNEYFNAAFTPNGKILLVSLKKLWIDDRPSRMSQSSSNQEMAKLSRQDIYAKFEFYIGSTDLYKPVLRVDTVFQLTRLKKVNDYDDTKEGKLPFFCFALEQMVENINFDIYINDSKERKEMSLADIANFNARMRDITILHDSIKQGVFLTLDEFKNNRPSVTSFIKRKIKKTKLSEVLDKKGDVILHYFAYFDGATLRIGKPISALFKQLPEKHDVLYRVGDTFQYLEYQISTYTSAGRTSEINTSSGRVPSIPFEISSHSMSIVPRQLDLEP